MKPLKKDVNAMPPAMLHAVTFLRFLKVYMSEDGVGVGQEKTKILPYDYLVQAFDEYRAHFKRDPQFVQTHVTEIAKKETFRKAYQYLYKLKEINLR